MPLTLIWLLLYYYHTVLLLNYYYTVLLLYMIPVIFYYSISSLILLYIIIGSIFWLYVTILDIRSIRIMISFQLNMEIKYASGIREWCKMKAFTILVGWTVR